LGARPRGSLAPAGRASSGPLPAPPMPGTAMRAGPGLCRAIPYNWLFLIFIIQPKSVPVKYKFVKKRIKVVFPLDRDPILVYDKGNKTTCGCLSGCDAVWRRSRPMKCLLWKCWILMVALALVLVLGAFAEGTMSLPLAAALCLAGYRILRAAWAAEQRAERQAARRALRRRAPAAAGHSRPASGEAARPDSLRVA